LTESYDHLSWTDNPDLSQKGIDLFHCARDCALLDVSLKTIFDPEGSETSSNKKLIAVIVVRNKVGLVTVETRFARRLHERMSAALACFGFIFAQGNLRSIEDNDGISTHIFCPT
jgi:hypothetical protein